MPQMTNKQRKYTMNAAYMLCLTHSHSTCHPIPQEIDPLACFSLGRPCWLLKALVALSKLDQPILPMQIPSAHAKKGPRSIPNIPRTSGNMEQSWNCGSANSHIRFGSSSEGTQVCLKGVTQNHLPFAFSKNNLTIRKLSQNMPPSSWRACRHVAPFFFLPRRALVRGPRLSRPRLSLSAQSGHSGGLGLSGLASGATWAPELPDQNRTWPTSFLVGSSPGHPNTKMKKWALVAEMGHSAQLDTSPPVQPSHAPPPMDVRRCY